MLPPDRWYLPTVAFSYGEAFHTEDPRIGNGTGTPTLLAPSRAYQLVLSKVIKQTQFYVTLRRISNSQELAKIDPDTGLQEIIGPSVNKVLSVSLQRNFTYGAIYVSYAQADARDSQTGEPIPEAPSFIWDTVASYKHLPFGLWARGEFEYVRAKPLGDGFTGVPGHRVSGRGAEALPRRDACRWRPTFSSPTAIPARRRKCLRFPATRPPSSAWSAFR